MSDDLSLFGDDAPAQRSRPEDTPSPVPDWQVNLLRKALDARCLTTMADRQHAIEKAVGRPVESLRALTQQEAFGALNRLRQEPTQKAQASSAWDDRDEDTWIDRL